MDDMADHRIEPRLDDTGAAVELKGTRAECGSIPFTDGTTPPQTAAYTGNDPAGVGITADPATGFAIWQARPLAEKMAAVYFGPVPSRIRSGEGEPAASVFAALGVQPSGRKQVLGLWLGQARERGIAGRAFEDLARRGVEQLGWAVIDVLHLDAAPVRRAFPDAHVQACVSHLLMASLRPAPALHRRALAAALKDMYHAASEAEALQLLARLDADRPTGPSRAAGLAVAMWRRYWDCVAPCFNVAPAIRQRLYTTNAVDSLHMKVRAHTGGRIEFESGNAALLGHFAALRRQPADWLAEGSFWGDLMPVEAHAEALA
jgi:transposase-like protein